MRQRLGETTKNKVLDHIWNNAFDLPTRNAIYRSAREHGYSHENLRDGEELLNHARDILVSPSRRATFHKVNRHNSEKESRAMENSIKSGWKRAITIGKDLDHTKLVGILGKSEEPGGTPRTSYTLKYDTDDVHECKQADALHSFLDDIEDLHIDEINSSNKTNPSK
jgi:hypothetical protein